jgi:hypothetical protein
MEVGWRLQRYDLGRRCNYEMAVWERSEETSGGNERGSGKKKVRRAILGKKRRIFEEKKLGRRELSRVSNLPLRLTES